MRKAEIKSRSRKISIDLDEGVEELDDLAPKNGVKLSVWNPNRNIDNSCISIILL